MQKAAVLITAVLLWAPLNAEAAESVTCDQASLAKLETQIGSMSGREKTQAMRLLAGAKKALAAGNVKRCQRIIARIGASSSATADINAANAQFVTDFNSKNAAAVASHYAEDAAAFPPDQMKVEGRENIQKMWQAVIDSGATDLALTSTEVEQSNALAFDSGSVSLKAPGQDGKPMDITGKYVVVWKKGKGGTWQLYRDIWNFDPKKSTQ